MVDKVVCFGIFHIGWSSTGLEIIAGNRVDEKAANEKGKKRATSS